MLQSASVEMEGLPKGRAAYEVCVFFGLTLLISWSIFALLALARPWAEETFGLIDTPPGMVGSKSPLWYLGVYTPSLVALGLTWTFSAREGVVRLLGRYVRGFSVRWAVVSLIVFPGVVLLARLVGLSDALAFQAAPALIVAYLMVVFSLRIVFDPGPVGEELGWRGFALPRLLVLMNPFWAGTLLGAIWAAWHLNAFLDPAAEQGQMFSFARFAWCALTATIVMTWLFVRARGNLLICGVITHLSLNAMIEAGISRVEVATVTALTALAVGVAIFDPVMRPFRARPLGDDVRMALNP